MKTRIYGPLTSREVRTSAHTGGIRRRREGAVLPGVTAGFALLICVGAFSGCQTLQSADCGELSLAAADLYCPERVVDRPVPQPAPIAVGDIEEPPALTSAELTGEEPVLEALRTLAADLRDSRSWGWTLYHKLQNLKAANAALLEGDPE